VQGKKLKLEQLMRSSKVSYWLGQTDEPMGS